MKRILLFAAYCTALGVTILAQDGVDADYQKWMNTVGATSGSLRKNLEAKNGESASADAKKLQEVFAQVHHFYQEKNVEDATKFAADARDAFRDIGEQASAGHFEDASAALKKAMSNCAGCHTAHREKLADGSYKMK